MLSFSSSTEGGPNIGFLGSIATASVSLIGLAGISSLATQRDSSSSSSSTDGESRLPSSALLLKGRLSDWTVWIGSAWILLRQQQEHQPDRKQASDASSSSASSWQLLSDFAFVGLLLFLRAPPPSSSSGSNGTEDKEGHSDEDSRKSSLRGVPQKSVASASRTQQFLQQIESNLGLTPKSHNRSNEDNPNLDELPLPRTLPVEAASTLSSFASSVSLQQQQQAQSVPQQSYLELLVHNVSHTDLVLSLDAPPVPENNSSNGQQQQGSNSSLPAADDAKYCLCRPRFSAFDAYSSRVLQTLAGDEKHTLSSQMVSFPRYERSDANNNRKLQLPIADDELVESRKQLPIGFKLEGDGSSSSNNTSIDSSSLLSVSPQERSDLRLRGRDTTRLDDLNCPTKLNAVFFPLLAMLLPQWQARLEEKYGSMASTNSVQNQNACKKVVILVSGVGSPRNWTHSMDGNSTEQCAKLMELFVRNLYPDCVVVQVHSNTNIFRYDENISFVQNELLPCIQSWRDAHATGLAYPDGVSSSNGNQHQNSNIGQKRVDHLAFDPDWNKTMSVTLSFADGSPARNHAIQAALRPYKPTYFHCWQLKTFWHELKIVDSDIEVHSFEEMETLPPIDLTTPLSNRRFQQQQPMALQVVEEMKAFKADMDSILRQADDTHDVWSFWLRKTRKPVLAVLAVQMTKDGPVKLYRGTNMEVSMPTGSLCAERNVIGTALAANPTLKRHHLKIIAVLSVPPPTNPEMSRTTSTASLGSMSGARVNSRSNSMDILDEPGANQTRLLGPAGRSSSGEWLLQDVAPPVGPTVSGDGDSSSVQSLSFLPHISTTDGQKEPPAMASNVNSATVSPSTTPARRISLYQHNTPHDNKTKRNGNDTKSRGTSLRKPTKRKTVVVVQSPEDLNPLRPCGACNEWLKKIAETNPYFQILTFTDKECNGVYCTPCEE